jgi:hypothetical protein
MPSGCRIDHVGIVGADFLVQALGRGSRLRGLRTVYRCTGAPSQTAAITFLQSRRAIDHEKRRLPQTACDQIIENGAPGFGRFAPMSAVRAPSPQVRLAISSADRVRSKQRRAALNAARVIVATESLRIASGSARNE